MDVVGKKTLAFSAPYTAGTFNRLLALLLGPDGVRVRGFTPSKLQNGTQVSLTAGVFAAATATGTILCEVTTTTTLSVVGAAPYGVVGYTADANAGSPITLDVLPQFDPAQLMGRALLATLSDTGADWVPAAAAGLDQVLTTLELYRQLTSAELAMLTGSAGITDANALHMHRGQLDRAAFEALTNRDYSQFPHVARSTAPSNADSYHLHANLLTGAEIHDLTQRPGTGDKDPSRQHTHPNSLDADQHADLVGGALANAARRHVHRELPPGLVLPSASGVTVPQGAQLPQPPYLVPGAAASVLGAHGLVFNAAPLLVYIPQNRGRAAAFVRANKSQFEGSVQLVLMAGPDGTIGIGGIRFKQFAQFWHSSLQRDTSGHPAAKGLAADPTQAPVAGVDTFGAGGPPGITDRPTGIVPFNTYFTWHGIEFYVYRPTFGAAPIAQDYFTAHGLVMSTASSPSSTTEPQNGSPELWTYMHERNLSFVPLRLAVVEDEAFPEGGFATIPYV